MRLYGGSNLAQPVCTFLPPGFPGHVDDCQYTKGGGTTWSAPDLDKAKQLVQASGTAGQEVGIVVSDDSVNKAIGIQYSVPIFNGFAVTSRVRESIALEDRARNDLETTRRNAARSSLLAVLLNRSMASIISGRR